LIIKKSSLVNLMTLSLLSMFVTYFTPYFSSDYINYEIEFNAFSEVNIFIIKRLEYLFYGWNYIYKAIGLDYSTFLFFSTFIFLWMKLKYLKLIGEYYALEKSSYLKMTLIYISMFFLIHDCIQLKISWALAWVLLGCLYYKKNHFIKSILFAMVGTLFHPTSIILYFAFILSNLLKKFPLAIILLLTFFMSIAVYFSVETIFYFAQSLNVKYGDYLIRMKNIKQNGTGLFYYYLFFFTMFISFIVLKFWKKKFYNIRPLLIISIFSCVPLFGFSSYVILASRFNDILTIFLVLLFSFILSRKNTGQITKIAVVAYCIVILITRYKVLVIHI
jgi:hypothetical protein